MLYALISPEEELIQTHDFPNDDIPNTRTGWRWIPIDAEPRPPYNPELQVATQFEDIQIDRVLRYWVIRSKTPAELEADRIQKVNAIDPTTMTALLDVYNRTVPEPLTLDEYKAHLRSLII